MAIDFSIEICYTLHRLNFVGEIPMRKVYFYTGVALAALAAVALAGAVDKAMIEKGGEIHFGVLAALASVVILGCFLAVIARPQTKPLPSHSHGGWREKAERYPGREMDDRHYGIPRRR